MLTAREVRLGLAKDLETMAYRLRMMAEPTTSSADAEPAAPPLLGFQATLREHEGRMEELDHELATQYLALHRRLATLEAWRREQEASRPPAWTKGDRGPLVIASEEDGSPPDMASSTTGSPSDAVVGPTTAPTPRLQPYIQDASRAGLFFVWRGQCPRCKSQLEIHVPDADPTT